MSRNAILAALNEELKTLEEDSAGMEGADGSGVQSRTVEQGKKPSTSEKKKGFKLTGGGGQVGGGQGGVTESTALDNADGKGVANKSPQEINGTDSSGAPTNSGAPEGAEKDAVDKPTGSTVAKPNVSKGNSGGGSNAKAVNKAKGSSVASSSSKDDGMEKNNDGVKENVIELPHDALVEDAEGNKKTLPKGTRIVIGNIDATEDVGDNGMLSNIVNAVVRALNGEGEYDYAMEGKEIQEKALLEDVKRLMEGKPWENDDEDDNEDDNEDEEEVEECAEDKDKSDNALSEELDFDVDGGESEDEEDEDEEHEEYAEESENVELDITDPAMVAGLINDITDDLDTLRAEMGLTGEPAAEIGEYEEMGDDEEGEEGEEGEEIELDDDDTLEF